MRGLEVGGSIITVLPVIKGLLSEAPRVKEAVEELEPDAICISISKEELHGLREMRGDEEHDLSGIEWTYAELLGRFGEVRVPPPCYSAALEIAIERGIRAIPLDMNEQLYSATYVTIVGTFDVLKESYFARRVKRMEFDLSSPESFVLDWDRRLNRSKGFSHLQRLREEHMAAVLIRIAKRYQRILATIEYERAEGVVDALESGYGMDSVSNKDEK